MGAKMGGGGSGKVPRHSASAGHNLGAKQRGMRFWWATGGTAAAQHMSRLSC
jgi:hypothetical protein